MKNTRSRAIVLQGIPALIVFLLVFITAGYHRVPIRPEEEETVVGEGGPGAGEEYEWMRLHDPATGRIPAGIHRKERAFSAGIPSREARASLEKVSGAASGQLVSWMSRGPANVGGRTRALAIDVTNPKVILAGGVSGGMWRSTDGGAAWVRTTLPTDIFSVSCIAQDTRPGKTHIWYYGTGEIRGNSARGGSAPYYGNGIFKSVDGGASWTLLPSTASGDLALLDQMFDLVSDIIVDPSTVAEDRVFASTIGGIIRSTDGGNSWTTVFGKLDDSQYTDVAVTSGGVLYATMGGLSSGGTSAASRGIWRSIDGVQWTKINPTAGWPSSFNRIVIGINPSNENEVYFLGETPGSGFLTKYAGSSEATSLWKYTYLSGDGSGSGGVWENRSSNLPAYGGSVGDFVSQLSYDLVVKVKPGGDSVLYVGGSNLYRSGDAFRTDTKTTWIGGYSPENNVTIYPNHHPDQHSLAFLPGDSSALYSGNDGGVSRTDDAAAASVSWARLNNGYATSQFYSVAIDHSTPGNSIVIGGTQDNGTWFTNEVSPSAVWPSILGGDGAFCAIANGRTSYYGSFQNGVIYRMLVNDATGDYTSWTRVDPQAASGFLFINPFALDPSNTDIMYLPAGRDLWRNSNLTEIPLSSGNAARRNWIRLSSSGIPGATITAVGVSHDNPRSRLYYGSNNGKVFRLDDADSADINTVPADLWTGKGLPANAYVSCIAVDPIDGNRALLIYSNYRVPSVFLTTDAGQTWRSVGGNLEQNADGSGNGPSVRWGAILPFGGRTTYFVGTSTGLYSTTELNGQSTVWAKEGESLIGNAVVDMIDTRPSDGLVVLATHGLGVFSGSLLATGVPGPATPVQFALQQNYPNPFNPSTTIRFSLARAAHVTLNVFSVAGQEVAALVDGWKDAGEHFVSWTPSGLASGVYIYTMKAGGYRASKKLALLK